MHIEASFQPIDRINPHAGYQVRIENSATGECLLYSQRDPATGHELKTEADCLRVISYYTATDGTRPAYKDPELFACLDPANPNTCNVFRRGRYVANYGTSTPSKAVAMYREDLVQLYRDDDRRSAQEDRL